MRTAFVEAVFSVSTDKNKNLWVGTTGGLNRLDKQTGHFKRYINKFLCLVRF